MVSAPPILSRGESIRLAIPSWLAKKRGLKATLISGEIEARSAKAVLVNGEWWPLSQVTILPAAHIEPAPRVVSDDPIPGLKTQAWAHQRSGFNFAMNLPAAMLAMDLGSGKSLVAAALAMARGSKSILILCPLSVVGVWPKQFATHIAQPVRLVALNSGSVADKAARARLVLEQAERESVPAVIVVNHESAWRGDFAEFALGRRWDCVIVDECHRLKQPGGKLSLFCAELRSRAAYRLGLSGTPMANNPLDLYAQFRFLNPSLFGTSYQRFKERYAICDEEYGRFVAPKNEEELYAKFYSRAYRVRSADVLDLPEAVSVERTFKMSPEARRVYQKLEAGFIARVKSGEITPKNALVQLLRLQQVTSGSVTTDEGDIEQVHTGKADVLAEILDDLEPREPVVVFCRFTQDLEAIKRIAEMSGRRYGEVSGRRKDLTPDSEMPADVDVLGVQIQSGGVGISLVRARYCIYMSIGFSLVDYQQSLARCRRPGQTRPVTYLHILAEDSVDSAVYGALSRKEDIIESILSGISAKENMKED